MPLIVRRLRVSDLPILEMMEADAMQKFPGRAGWLETYTKLVERALAEEPEGILIAEYDGRVIGGAIVRQRGAHGLTGIKHAVLLTLTVAQGWKDQGIATRLVREAEAYSKARGCESMTVTLPADSGTDAEVFKTSGYRVMSWELERSLK